MIRVAVEIRERTVCRRVRITAPSIARALQIAGDGLPGRRVRIVFPIAPEAFFSGDEPPAKAAPVPPELKAA